MFTLEVDKNVQNDHGYLKKKKRKHHSPSESDLMHQESKKLKLIDSDELEKKKHAKSHIKKSCNEISVHANENMHDEISSNNNFPKKKKKKRKEETGQSLDVFVTEHLVQSEVSDDDLKIMSKYHVTILKKGESHRRSDKSKAHAVDEDISGLNTEQNDGYLYKKKKKLKEDCLLDEAVTRDFIKREQDDDYNKKSKKKKKKERQVVLKQEEEEVVQKKVKKRKHSAPEATESEKECTDPPLKRSKKHKYKDKVLEPIVSNDSSPIKCKKEKHTENVAMFEDTQLSFFTESVPSEIVEEVQPFAHKKPKKLKPDVAMTEDVNTNTFNKKMKKHKNKNLYSMEEKVSDIDNSAIDNLIYREKSVRKSLPMSTKSSIDSSPEGNIKYKNEYKYDNARSESVSNDTFTLDIHEDDTHSILNNISSSDDTAEERLHPKKQFCTDNSKNNVLKTTNHRNKSKKKIVNVQRSADIPVKATNLKKEHLSYKQLLEQVKDKSQVKESFVNDLSLMSITIPWAVPSLHLIETRVCSRPTKEQRTQMESLGIEIKTGIYTKSEDDQIRNNWKEFCRIHDLTNEDPTPFLNVMSANGSLILSIEERINFVRFLAHGLYNRPLHSVYKRFQRLFLADKIKTGRFSPEEDNIIRKYMECTSRRTPYSDLAKILNRDRLAVEKRCKALESNDDSLRWDKENIAVFLKYILEITGSNDLSSLKDREIKPQEWKLLSEKLEISSTKLQRAWACTIHPQLFIKDSISSNAIKVALIKKLIENNENDWRSVDWELIAKDFDGFTGLKLNKFIKDSVGYHVPQDIHNNLGESLRFLDKLISQKKIFSRRTLKKLHINESLLRT